MLPVSGAFHTQLVAPAKDMLTTAIKAAQFSEGSFAVYSNQTAQRYPATASAIRALLDQHMLSPVEFVAEIDAMHAAGRDRKSVVEGKRVSGRVELGGRRIITKQKN